jgi:guanosine-3',5'-bis(diphosphate) 3'-pyrophosphohydrolase
VIRELGFRKAEDFYIALGAAKISPKTVVARSCTRLKQGEAADADADRA